MPLWLRRTTFNLIKEFYEKESEENEKQQNSLRNTKNEVSRPNITPKIQPTYTSKAPKK